MLLGEAITLMQLASTSFVLEGVYVVNRVNFDYYPDYYCGVELLTFLLLHQPNRARIYQFGQWGLIPPLIKPLH
jgi:hypothetical protein